MLDDTVLVQLVAEREGLGLILGVTSQTQGLGSPEVDVCADLKNTIKSGIGIEIDDQTLRADFWLTPFLTALAAALALAAAGFFASAFALLSFLGSAARNHTKIRLRDAIEQYAKQGGSADHAKTKAHEMRASYGVLRGILTLGGLLARFLLVLGHLSANK